MVQCEYRSNSASLTSGVAAAAQMDHECRSSEQETAAQLPSYQHQPKEHGDQDQDSLDKEDAADGAGISKSDHQVLADELLSEDFDDGYDGELIIDVEDDKHVSHPTTCSGLTSDEDRTPTLAQGCELNIISGIRHRNGARNEAQQKMEEGKQWLTKSLLFVNTVLSVVPLSLIEEAYQTYCREAEKEPLTTPVLARLIRALYPGAVKCRLGSRGNQRIHYRCLKLKSFINSPVNDCVSLPVEGTTSISVQENQHSEDCVQGNPKSEALSTPVDGKQNINHGVSEESGEDQDRKACTKETPNQKNLKSHMTPDDDQKVSQFAKAQEFSQELFVPGEGGDKHHISHGALRENCGENQDRKACTTEISNKKNLKSHMTLSDDQKVCPIAKTQELSQELFVPDGDGKHHISHGAPRERSGEYQVRKVYTTETPNQETLNSLFTVDNDQKVSHLAAPRLSQESSEPDDDDKPPKNHGATGKKSGENQDTKEISIETPNQKDLNSFITVDDGKEGCQPAAQRISQDLFASEGNNKQHINHIAAREKSCGNQDGNACTAVTPNQMNPKSHSTIDDDQEGCQPAAERLLQVLRWISSQGRRDVFLREFAHSASCKVVPCTPLCSMFCRVRRHVVAARHSCSVLRIYSGLLRLHVSSCNNSDCGLPACPALRAIRPVKRSLGQQGNSSKRSAVQRPGGVMRPSTLVLAPRSPESSLPGSPVNSPPASPEHSSHARDSSYLVQPGQVQYVIVPVMSVVMPFSDNRGV
ncbi:uncharacterized protein [Panulirus ornatus]|uniref:uncharacterized protein isoform X2 n=1 Tax=Panulirus ornatus TaxID=150431 RepID=UPI003A86A8BC